MGGDPTTPDRPMPKAGDVIAGKYTIVRVLGEGGMGIVYEATHMRLRQRVAVKMLLPAMLQHEILVSRFEREARAAAQLRGRHCARVNDVDVTADGLPYMVMDFLEGHDLEVELQRRGRLTVGEAVDYVLQACAAMVEAHHLNIIHRDLKPSNLFLAMNGEDGQVVKVLDFGISKVSTTEHDAKLTAVDTVMGTPFYMSPEQIKASHAVDVRSDIWSLGVILYELLAGIVPWTGTSPHQVAAMIVTEDPPDLRTLPGMADLPAELVAIIHKTLQRDPQNRFATVRELAAALAPFTNAGTAGRAFADNIPESRPRVSAARAAEVATAAPTHVSEPRILAAVGVTAERMAPQGTGTTPGWSPPTSEPSRSRVGLIVALGGLLTLVAIGATVLVMKRPASAASAAATAEPSASVKAVPTTMAGSPSAPSASSTPSTTETSASSAAIPSASVAKPVVAGVSVHTTTTLKASASTTASAPSSSPTPAPTPTHHPTPPPKSSANDKPLFL